MTVNFFHDHISTKECFAGRQDRIRSSYRARLIHIIIFSSSINKIIELFIDDMLHLSI